MQKIRKYLHESETGSLASKLAAYSAAITGAMTLCTSAKAGVVYTPQIPDSSALIQTGNANPTDLGASIDFNGDGIVDIEILVHTGQNISGGTINYGAIFCVVPAGNAVLGNLYYRQGEDSVPTPLPVSFGEYIGVSGQKFIPAPYGGDNQQIMGLSEVEMTSSGSSSATVGNWLSQKDKFLGIQFLDSDNHLHYGWIKLSTHVVPDTAILTFIEGYAYESTPNVPIIAGDTTGAATGLSSTVNGATGICLGNSTQLTDNVSGATGSLAYTWSPSTGLSDALIANPVASPTVTTTYTVKATDGTTGFTTFASVTVNVAPLNITGQATQIDSCGASNGSVVITVENGQPPYTYLWLPNSDTTARINNLAPGTYNVSVTDSNGCKGHYESVIANPCNDSVGTTGNETISICPGGSVQLNVGIRGGDGGFTYSWTPGAGLSDSTILNPVANPSGTTTYTLLVRDSSGFTAKASILVKVAPLNITGQVTQVDSCGVNDGSIALTIQNGQPPYTLQWSNNDTTRIIENLAPGDYAATVTDSAGCKGDYATLISNPCDSVWPGDANNDGVADANDILQIALVYGSVGPVRPDASMQWIGQPATDWDGVVNGINNKHSDSDGNGVVNADDTLAVTGNYDLTHHKTGQRAQPSDPYLTLVPAIDTIQANSLFSIKIMLGTAAVPVDTLYGLAFTINFDPAIFDSSSAQLNTAASWMGTVGTNLLSFRKGLSGQVAVVLTRIDHQNINGNGEIGELTLMTNSGLTAGLANLTPEIINGVSANGSQLTFNTQASQVIVATGINTPSIDKDVNIYPNPNNGQFQFIIDGFSHQINIELLDVQGKQLYQEKLNDVQSLNKEYDFSYLAKGIYLLKVSTENGTAMKRLVIQ